MHEPWFDQYHSRNAASMVRMGVGIGVVLLAALLLAIFC
jgi:hypothetical protein